MNYPASGQYFVVRGILDGYLLLTDRIILFDYKTDRYTNPSELVERYQAQLALYAEALSRSYSIEKVEKYLVLSKLWIYVQTAKETEELWKA